MLNYINMGASLYKKAFEELLEKNSNLFSEFSKIHDLYKKDQSYSNKVKFDNVGKNILRLIEEKERWLCSRMDSSGHGKYSSVLSDKFRAEARAHFPLIDLVGVTIT